MAKVIKDYSKQLIGVAAREKMKILRHLYIFGEMPKNKKWPEATKEKMKKTKNILLKCGSEHEMTRILHDVIMGKETIDEFIARKAGL